MNKVLKHGWLLATVAMFGCTDNNDEQPVYYFYDEPAVVKSVGDVSVIRAAKGDFYVQPPEGETLTTGDLLWTAFVVDLNDEHPDKAANIYNTRSFTFEKVDSSKVIIPTDVAEFQAYMSDNYRAFIDEAVLYKDYLDRLLFFGFTRANSSDENIKLDYEIVLSPVIEAEAYPTLYIRSRKTADEQEHYRSGRVVYAFDMSAFVDWYRKNISSKGDIKFNLKYKTGSDEDGNDVYRSFRSNPLAWTLANSEQ